MTKVALAEKPLDVAVGRGANPVAAQCGPLVAVALRVGPVALQAMIAIDERAGHNCLGMIGEWIRPRMLLGWNMVAIGNWNPRPAISGGHHDKERIKRKRRVIVHLPGPFPRCGTSSPPG